MVFPIREVVEAVRARYPVGTRVELVSMNDPYSKLKPGDRGTVRSVDDTGTNGGRAGMTMWLVLISRLRASRLGR